MLTNTVLHTLQTKFGKVEATAEAVLNSQPPLPGFEGLSKYTLIRQADQSPIIWLQSLEEAALALPLVEPDLFFPGYSSRVQELTGSQETVLCLVTRQGDQFGMNLLAPVLLNDQVRELHQVVLTDPELELFHPLVAPPPCSSSADA